jgi:hypothetical protein
VTNPAALCRPTPSLTATRGVSVALVAALALACLFITPAIARDIPRTSAPQADALPRSWQLDLKISPLRIVNVDVGKGEVRPFYYFTYTVTNNTGQDIRLFVPSWDMMAGDGTMIRSGRDVPVSVTAQIMERCRNENLQDQIAIIGPLAQGRENALDGLVVFAASSLRPEEVVIFAAGFSGETATYLPPVPITRADGTVSSEPVILRKTLMMRFAAPGDLSARGDEPLPMIEQRWVMR